MEPDYDYRDYRKILDENLENDLYSLISDLENKYNDSNSYNVYDKFIVEDKEIEYRIGFFLLNLIKKLGRDDNSIRWFGELYIAIFSEFEITTKELNYLFSYISELAALPNDSVVDFLEKELEKYLSDK